MRRAPVLRGILAIALIAMLAIAPADFAHASNVSFRGGPEDHWWDVDVMFCKDGFKISANEVVQNDGGTGDEKPYALVITTTAPLIADPLPAIIGRWQGGVTHPLASATRYYAYTAPQPATAPVSITLERWDHGDNSTIDTGEESPGDDRDSYSSTARNCTLLTPPEFDIPPSPANGAVFLVAPGQPIAFQVEGSDADGIDSVTLGASGLPPGASFGIPPAANPAVSTFSWTPAPGQRGSYVVHFSATDQTGRSAPAYAVTIRVALKVFAPLIEK
jgi:hypothetical protein